MGAIGIAEQSLAEGDLEHSLSALMDKVRNDPSNVENRVFLFQLLAILGQWDRALTQLKVVGELDAITLAMVQTYRPALHCEVFRAGVFDGKRSPLVFGNPEQWIALLLEALKLSAQGQLEKSQTMREEAFEQASVTSGVINEQPFEWIADADPRLGPTLECILNGRYYWIPFNKIREINIEEPCDLRDEVWMPAYFTWANGGEAVGLIPTRYPGTEKSEDSQLVRAKKTAWIEQEKDLFLGLGQRMLATDQGEYPIMDIRNIKLNVATTDSKNQSSTEPQSSDA